MRRADFNDYDAFKAAHARNGAAILRAILQKCGVNGSVTEEACRLVGLHEAGGDPRSDLPKDADSISYFEVNIPMYYQREGWEETRRRCSWGLGLSASLGADEKDRPVPNIRWRSTDPPAKGGHSASLSKRLIRSGIVPQTVKP